MLTLYSVAVASPWGLGTRRVCQEADLFGVAREVGEFSQLFGLQAAFAPSAVTPLLCWLEEGGCSRARVCCGEPG